MRRMVLAVLLLPLICCGVAQATEQMVIDDIEYATVEDAREHWGAPEVDWPLSLIDHDGGKAVRLDVDFTGDMRRAALDYTGDLDLTGWGRFSLDIYIDDPRMFGAFTLYMQSGDGWYRATGDLKRKGWSTLHFPRSAFGTEDTPAGWDTIRTIRVSPWKGAPITGYFAVDNLVAYREDWAVVIGSYAQGTGEAKTVQKMAEGMSNILADAGIMTSTIGDEDVEAGALKDYKVAIFAYNPQMSEGEVDQVREFVDGGGKIMAFYSIPASLAEIMGFKPDEYVKEEPRGQFSLIKFDAPDLLGMPAEVRQHSWNINTVVPDRDDARIIAWWYDDQGQPTGHPAFAMSDTGVFMTHVLTSDDYGTKKRMMQAMLGHYFPDIWEDAARASLDPPGQLGHLPDVQTGRAWIQGRAADAPDGQRALAAIADADATLAKARGLVDEGQYPAAIDLASGAWNMLGESYLMALTPRPGEFRAVWEHSGAGPLEDWDASMKRLAENGFTAVVPNQLWGGVALYDSEFLPHTAVVDEVGDQVALAVAAGKKYGVEVHPWKVNWNLGSRTPAWFKDQLREEGRLQRNQQLEVDTMVEVARNYDVAGVHFDYIRYPGGTWCFCDGCRERFQAATGVVIENWPEDTKLDAVKDKWVQWRCDNISTVVRETAERVRAIKPDCKISAAVFSAYPSCRVNNGQDWVYWCRQGWLDFVCPMDYTGSDTSFATTVATQMSQVEGTVPLYPGIGASASRSTLGAGRVAGQIQIARNLGADGFIIFNYTRSLADEVIPGVGISLTKGATFSPDHAPAYSFDIGELTRDVTFGRHAQAGDAVTVTVARADDIPGRVFGAIVGAVVLQDDLGAIVQEFGAAPGMINTENALQIEFTVREGLQRVAVMGTYTDADNQSREFVARSLPIIGGQLGGIVADVL